MVDIFAGSPREGSFLILAAPSLIQFEVSGSFVFLNFGAEHCCAKIGYEEDNVKCFAIVTNLIFYGSDISSVIFIAGSFKRLSRKLVAIVCVIKVSGLD